MVPPASEPISSFSEGMAHPHPAHSSEPKALNAMHSLQERDSRPEVLPSPLEDQIQAFRQRYWGQVAQLSGAELAAALEELSSLWAAFPGIPGDSGVQQDAQSLLEWLEHRITLQNRLLFFLLELQALPVERLAEYRAEPTGLPFRVFLSRVLCERGHWQPELLECLLRQQYLTGRFAWQQLWQTLLHVPERHSLKTHAENAFRPTRDESFTLGELQQLQTHPSAEMRLAAYQCLHQHLEAHADLCGFILSTLVRDHRREAQWRGYDSPVELYLARHCLAQAVFENLMEGIRDRVDLFQRYYRLKSREMGRSIRICDLQAPWEVSGGMADLTLQATEAAALVLAALQEFCPECATQCKPWLSGEATAEESVTSAGTESPVPQVLITITGQRLLQPLLDSVARVSQELRAADPVVWPELEDIQSSAAPAVLSQVHSQFLLLLVLDYLLYSGRGGWAGSREELHRGNGVKPALAHALLIHHLEAQLQTVFCQSLITRLELTLYRQGIPELQNGKTYSDWVSEEWLKLYQELCGDAVELLPEHQFNWIGIRELFQRPLSAYQASLSSLMALAWYRRYQLSPREFLPRYLSWLASPPGSLTLEETALLLQVDIADPDLFLQALEEMENWIETLEELLEDGPASDALRRP
ncbi:MAG: peptidase M3 [Cyanobacteriota bacterium]